MGCGQKKRRRGKDAERWAELATVVSPLRRGGLGAARMAGEKKIGRSRKYLGGALAGENV